MANTQKYLLYPIHKIIPTINFTRLVCGSLFVCLSFSGCWELDIGPRPGLEYKHKITGEEIKIEGMGWGRDIYKACSTLVSTTNPLKRQFLGYDQILIIYNPAYDNRVCVVYEHPGDFEKKQPTYLYIIPAREIWVNYQRTGKSK